MNKSKLLLALIGGLSTAQVYAKRDVVPQVKIEKGTMIDNRNKLEYETAKIGSQWWMAENLDIAVGNWKCYDDDAGNCKKYGRLYDWETAKKACPDGWHLPAIEEWNVLISTVGGITSAGKMLKSSSGWKGDGNGNDAYGLNAIPSGVRMRFWDGSAVSEQYRALGYAAVYWSSSEDVQYNTKSQENLNSAQSSYDRALKAYGDCNNSCNSKEKRVDREDENVRRLGANPNQAFSIHVSGSIDNLDIVSYGYLNFSSIRCLKNN